jgi:predicted ribosome quality control (RQC) complex YloA/Tae2 family protein
MPIRWDPVLARALALELDQALRGARVRGLRVDGEARHLTLLLEERTLEWALHPLRGWLRLGGPGQPAEGDSKLRGRVVAVESPPDERIVRIVLSPADSGPVALVVELMGNQWNALLVEGDPGVIRHALVRRESARPQRVGEPYRPPAPMGRSGPAGQVSEAEWRAVLAGAPHAERSRTLVRSFAWTSPLNADTLLGAPAEPGGPAGLDVGYRRWRPIAEGSVPAQPVVLELPTGLQPYPFPLAATPHHSAPSLLAAFAECAAAAGDARSAATAAIGTELLARLQGALRRAEGRVARMEAESATLEDPAVLRSIADLILARYAEIPHGAAHARLVGFDERSVDVELDPALAPHANAARYYQRATKAERAAERLPRLLEQARAARDRCVSLLERALGGSADEAEIRAALGSEAPHADTPREARLALPYRVFRSSGGLEIRVGRGAAHNDDLTFHHSAPGDVWLHARHVGGAHVILRWAGPGNPPARDLGEAATLAALHSKARTSSSVPVDWTFRKYVRKPRKAPPGRVVAERVETLFVTPDERLLTPLAAGPATDPSPS